ncbi:hypothetical protein [Aequorivita sinensis]|uniref:hypothetical protein n=1 Tax=Aequorivita sinensis TaxID=1382458 RepID=UPI0023016C3C|nr:hypothetical protein [Aequorivita sinensis]
MIGYLWEMLMHPAPLLNHEIERLRALKKINNNIRQDEIQRALDEQEELSILIKNARVRMDAVQFIIIE